MVKNMFGNFFKNLRKSKNVTQKQIADAIGKSTMLISGIETGKNGPFTEADLELISKTLMLSETEKSQLFIEAAKTKRTLPAYLLDYVASHDDVYTLLEVLAQKNMEGKSLKEIVKYAKEIGKNV